MIINALLLIIIISSSIIITLKLLSISTSIIMQDAPALRGQQGPRGGAGASAGGHRGPGKRDPERICSKGLN